MTTSVAEAVNLYSIYRSEENVRNLSDISRMCTRLLCLVFNVLYKGFR
jgi:hypothetical protein